MLPLEVRDFGRETTGIVNGTRRHVLWLQDTVRDGNAVIVFTERRRLVDDTGALIGFDVGVVENTERPVFELHRSLSGQGVEPSPDAEYRTCSVKYSNNGTYRQPFMSEPL